MPELPLILTLDELDAWSHTGPAPVDFSPFGENPALLVHLQASDSDPTQRLGDWLQRLVCPVIGIGGNNAPLAPYCDLIAEDASEAGWLYSRIAANPIAATTLMELLRVTESMPVEQALRVESLAYATLQAGTEYADWLAKLPDQPVPQIDEGPAVVMERSGGELRLHLNRPSNRNAMSIEMRDALNEALRLVLADTSIETVHITGRGKCFSTGGDLSEFGTVPDAATGHIVRGLSVPGGLLAACADRASVHVHGACIGSGLEFPAFAGHLTADRQSHFQLPEIGMGLIPGAGGCISIPRRIGRQRCAWLAISGKRIRADQALSWGLVDEIVD